MAKLWTVWCEYFETGCGVAYMAVITYAKDKKDAKAQFARHFDEYYADDCTIEKGIVKNKITKLLFTSAMFKKLEENEKNSGALHAVGEYHINKS